jgi:glycosyltransferase involved in cell wall biosynthesis
LCKGLAALGHEVHVFTTDVDGSGRLDVPIGTPVLMDGVQVWYFHSDFLRRLTWAPGMGRALADRVQEFDLVHAHSLFLWPTLVAARAARARGVPYFLSPRGMLVPELIRRKSRVLKAAWIRLFERRNLERATALHMTSFVEEREARAFPFRFPPMFVIPNGIDVAGPDPAAGPPEMREDDLVLFLGRVHWKKGLDRLVRALPHVRTARLVVAGNDEENYTLELKRLAADCGVSDRIAFPGVVMGQDKEGLLRRASLLVLPSYNENFGNVVLEAMAAGCPVLVTPEVGAADVVLEAGAGRVAGGEPESLGRAIGDMLSDRECLSRMGWSGREAARTSFSWESIARRMEQQYRLR